MNITMILKRSLLLFSFAALVPEKLVKVLTEAVEDGIRHRYAEAVERKKHSGSSVDAGRKFVEAYVVYVHFVEGLHRQLKCAGHHRGAETCTEHQGH